MRIAFAKSMCQQLVSTVKIRGNVGKPRLLSSCGQLELEAQVCRMVGTWAIDMIWTTRIPTLSTGTDQTGGYNLDAVKGFDRLILRTRITDESRTEE